MSNGRGYGGGNQHVGRGDFGALEQRVYGIERSIAGLAETTNAQINALTSSISNLGTKIDERSKIPWPALGFLLSVVVVIGGMAWYPVKNDLTRTEAGLLRLADKAVLDDDLAKYDKGIERRLDSIEQTAAENQKAIVPRGEHSEKWAAQRDRDADMQRQIDAIKKDFGELYSPRDALTSMQKRLDDLERSLRGVAKL